MRKKNWHDSLCFLKIEIIHAHIQKISSGNNPNTLIKEKQTPYLLSISLNPEAITFYSFGILIPLHSCQLHAYVSMS